MKDLNTYISLLNEKISSIDDYITEKLKISKHDKVKHEYFPTSQNELYDIVCELVKQQSTNDIIDLTSIDTSQIKDMSYLFNLEDFKNIKSIDLSGWDVSNVTTMECMFYNCAGLKEIIGIHDWEISNVKNMQYIFYNCKKLVLDLTKWDININCTTNFITYRSPNVKINQDML